MDLSVCIEDTLGEFTDKCTNRTKRRPQHDCFTEWECLELAESCAGACEECADECEHHDAEHCQVCADVLRDCAESCRTMMA